MLRCPSTRSVTANNPGNTTAAGESRVEDLIDITDLVQLADTLARRQSRSASLPGGIKDAISVSFPTSKVEPYKE
jgi:hypothetical protein